MKNDFIIRGDTTAIIINSPKYGPLEALIDTADLPIVGKFKGSWYVYFDPSISGFYVQGKIQTGGRRRGITLHRYLTDAPKGMQVDHKNHNTLDNRRSVNLRVCSASENKQNAKSSRRDSKSGIRGVTWHKYRRKWVVQVRVDGRQNCIGYFSDIRDAESAAITARKRLMTHSSA